MLEMNITYLMQLELNLIRSESCFGIDTCHLPDDLLQRLRQIFCRRGFFHFLLLSNNAQLWNIVSKSLRD